jgi:hypothetical protein
VKSLPCPSHEQKQPDQRQPPGNGQEIGDRDARQQRRLDEQTGSDGASQREERQHRPAGAEKRQIKTGMLEGVAEILEILENERFAQRMVFRVADQYQKEQAGKQRAGGKEGAAQNEQQAGKEQQPESEVERERRQRPAPERQRRRPQQTFDERAKAPHRQAPQRPPTQAPAESATVSEQAQDPLGDRRRQHRRGTRCPGSTGKES